MPFPIRLASAYLPALLLVLQAALLPAATVAPSWNLPPTQQTAGQFWMHHWYERAAPFQPPPGTRRLRINAPETSLGKYGRRIEASENGLMLIHSPSDLFLVTAAELYAELWGGHPGTANKRVTINGRSTYALPRVGTEDGHCTYSYPVIPLKVSDLVNGYNAVQWSLDQGTTFWGHAMVDHACLRLAWTNGHPELAALGLSEFQASVSARPLPDDGEILVLQLDATAPDTVSSVVFQAWHTGYDENGDGRETDWHGFTFDRQWRATAGAADRAPFKAAWVVRMLPAQRNVAVRALVRFHRAPGLVYVTPATGGLAVPDRARETVHLVRPSALPAPFWSRAGNVRECALDLDADPDQLVAAELYVVSWTGGAGTVRDYFTLNGRAYPVAEGDGHHIQFNRLPVDPSSLRRGRNVARLHSDTDHHGIEIIWPGPALMIRQRVP